MYIKAVCTNDSIRLINIVVTSSSSISSNNNSLDDTESVSLYNVHKKKITFGKIKQIEIKKLNNTGVVTGFCMNK